MVRSLVTLSKDSLPGCTKFCSYLEENITTKSLYFTIVVLSDIDTESTAMSGSETKAMEDFCLFVIDRDKY